MQYIIYKEDVIDLRLFNLQTEENLIISDIKKRKPFIIQDRFLD